LNEFCSTTFYIFKHPSAAIEGVVIESVSVFDHLKAKIFCIIPSECSNLKISPQVAFIQNYLTKKEKKTLFQQLA